MEEERKEKQQGRYKEGKSFVSKKSDARMALARGSAEIALFTQREREMEL